MGGFFVPKVVPTVPKVVPDVPTKNRSLPTVGCDRFLSQGASTRPILPDEFRIGEISTESAPPDTPSGEALEYRYLNQSPL
jgi:hypothetical protein